MTIQVQITAYDRIPLLLQCIEHLRKSLSYAERTLCVTCEYNIFLDHCACSESAIRIMRTLAEAGDERFRHCYCTDSSTPIGADLNILRSIENVEDDDYNHVFAIKLDSDVLVSEHFVHDMVVLANKFNGMATSTMYGKDPLDVKIANSNNITKWAMSGANFCIDVRQLNKLLPMATALIKTYKQNGHNPATTAEEWKVMKDLLRLYAPLHNEMNSPHRDFLLNSDVPNTGSDAMIAVAAWCHGIPIVSYTVNRAIHPSDTGVNTTREFWEQHYAGVTLDELPPADPSKFKFV